MKHFHVLAAGVCVLLTAMAAQGRERLILLNEGNWQADNGRVSYFEDGRIVSNQWFRDVNGSKLGDTPNDIIRVNDSMLAIAVNWSNIVQFITPEGKAIGATEDVPNNRKLATDGDYVYVSSYGHECTTEKGILEFEKGFVAKIDASTLKTVDAVEVGYEPEGIALYRGHLFVANTGGYAFNENHEYETTVSVIDAATMQVVRTVDVGQINLYGKMSQIGQYLCINSPGDYYDIQAATIIFDCDAALDGKDDEDCHVNLEYAATYNCPTTDGRFFAIGSRYSYITSEYTFNYITIDPALAFESYGAEGVDEDGLPGTVKSDIMAMTMPYGIYVNPYSGYIYATDAGEFVAGGALYQWTPEGELLGKHGVYINPAHFLALPDDKEQSSSISAVASADSDTPVYNLQGMRVTRPVRGQVYIRGNRKFIQK